MQRFKRIIPVFILILLVTAGFLFRLQGITENHSFWSDEALSASFARDIVLGKIDPLGGATSIVYQPLHIITMAVFMKIFGISEFSARLPSVLFGSIGIIIAYLLADKLSGKSGGLLAAFLFSFAQINLSNSTQAKPTAALQTMTLLIIYLTTLLSLTVRPKQIIFHLITIISIAIATLYHFLGALLVLIYLSYLFFYYRNIFFRSIILLLIGIGILVYAKAGVSVAIFNNTMYLRNLIFRQYGIFLLPTVASVFFLYKKYKAIIFSVIIYSGVLLLWWNYQSYSHNLRYIIPYFGILFVLASVGIVNTGKWLSKKHSWIMLSVILLFLLISREKLTLKPLHFYSPNKDFYGDVQIANYKEFYGGLEKKFPDLSNMVIYNDVLDSQRWYLKKSPDAYFEKKVDQPLINKIDGKKRYGHLNEFKQLQSKNKKGLLVVEDWESILPEDIKQYAKKHLKLELRIESLPQAQDDPWPLELYSWGI